MVDEPSPHATPISTKFHSMHVESLREAIGRLDVNNEQAKAKVEIELSKVHWSELMSSHYLTDEGPTTPEWIYEEGTREWMLEVAEDNVHVFQSLQEKYPGGFFFDDGTPLQVEFRLSCETPFAEGGQAELFHAHAIDLDDGKKYEVLVMKVFKEGMPLRDLLKFFPATMLANDQTCIEGYFGGEYFNTIAGLILLKSTGRFAFLMTRAWGDLRKLIDTRLIHSNTQDLPFLDDVAFYIIYQIAKGMVELHERDIIHRDLKASNVLVFGLFDEEELVNSIIDPIHLQTHQFYCQVADFECSVGIVGVRFWRAPEILEALKNRNIFRKPELFTKQADVYSFGMTCYEILSGGIPFEELRTNDYDSVIGGMRPMLPSQTPPWMVDLVNRCWHKDPSMRPPFDEIVEILEPYVLGS